MKFIKTFESFINEGKDWSDFTANKVADMFINDYDYKEATSAELDEWLSMFAQQKRIENAVDSSFAEELVNALNSKGYKNISMDGLTIY
jgi:hypothetical protein